MDNNPTYRVFRLDPLSIMRRGTLWQLFVAGIRHLGQMNPNFQRLTTEYSIYPSLPRKEEAFRHENGAIIRFYKEQPTLLRIEASSLEKIKVPVGDLTTICQREGCSLVAA